MFTLELRLYDTHSFTHSGAVLRMPGKINATNSGQTLNLGQKLRFYPIYVLIRFQAFSCIALHCLILKGDTLIPQWMTSNSRKTPVTVQLADVTGFRTAVWTFSCIGHNKMASEGEDTLEDKDG